MKKFIQELNFFSKVIRTRRYELNLTQERIAEIINCHTNAIGRLERCQAVPSYLMVLKIAKALKISPKDLMPD